FLRGDAEQQRQRRLAALRHVALPVRARLDLERLRLELLERLLAHALLQRRLDVVDDIVVRTGERRPVVTNGVLNSVRKAKRSVVMGGVTKHRRSPWSRGFVSLRRRCQRLSRRPRATPRGTCPQYSSSIGESPSGSKSAQRRAQQLLPALEH